MTRPGQSEQRVLGHRPGLDGIRGLAVAAVVAYHLGYLSGGFLGVDVFFVLSGFLITSLALREIDGTGGLGLRAFWGRRVRRLLPALLLMVTVAMAVAMAMGWPRTQLHALGWDGISTLTWWANWRQVGGPSYWASGENLFRHAWSLAIEEQFYVVWPLVLVASAAVARRLGRSVAVVVGVVAGLGATASALWQVTLAHRLAPQDLSRVYVGTDTRAVAPLLGCVLACVLAARGGDDAADHEVDRPARRYAGWVSGAVLVALMVTAEVSSPELYRHGWLVVASLAAALVVASTSQSGPAGRDPLRWVANRQVTNYLGLRSYGIYLWSWPVQVLVRFRWPDVAKPVLALVTVVISLAVAELSYRFVEDPIRRRTGWAATLGARRPAWSLGIGAATLVVVTALVLAVAPPVHEQVDTAEAAADALRPAPTVPPEQVADPEAPHDLRVMVTGDSVAWTVGYYKPPADALPAGIASIDSRAVIGCGLLAAEGWEYPEGGHGGPWVNPGSGSCAKQAEAEAIGLSASPDVVLLFPGAWEWSEVRSPAGVVYPAESPELAAVLRDRLLRRIDAASAVGARFVMVAWSCPGAGAAGVRKERSYITWINHLMAEAVDEAVRERGAAAEVLLPTDTVCIDGDPAGEPTAAKVEATGDEVHVVSDAGGRWIWDAWLAPALVVGA